MQVSQSGATVPFDPPIAALICQTRAMATPDQPDQADQAEQADPPELTLEELAESTGVAARTIRYYQAEKLLQKPERDRADARVARYGPAHVERLRLIGELRDRGLKLPAIRNLLSEGDASTRIADWLGLDESLRGAWGSDEPRILQREELAAMLTGVPAGTQGHLEDARLIIRQGAAWLVPTPALLELTIGLIGGGAHVDLVLQAGAILQKCLGMAAEELIELFVTGVRKGQAQRTDTGALVDVFRPAAGDAARMIFERQLQHAIEGLLADTKRLGRK